MRLYNIMVKSLNRLLFKNRKDRKERQKGKTGVYKEKGGIPREAVYDGV